MTLEVGRLVLKTAGRDAGKRGVIVDVIDPKTALVDGEVRRRKANVTHLLLLEEKVKLAKGASHDTVKKALEPLGIKTRQTKPKKAAPRAKARRATPKAKARPPQPAAQASPQKAPQAQARQPSQPASPKQ